MVKAKINIVEEKFAKNLTVVKRVLKAEYLNKPLKEAYFTSKTPLTRAKILHLVKLAQEKTKKEKVDVDFIVGLKYEGGHRSGKLFSLDAEPDLFDPDTFYSGEMSNKVDKKGKAIHIKQQSTFKSFYIITVPRATKKGGADLYNDCLFNAIIKGLNGVDNINIQWNSGEKFKNRLGLERKELVSVDLFPLIEEGLKINLNCYGSSTYVSEGKHKRTVNVNLSLNHFSLDSKHTNKKFTVQLNSKPIAFYEVVDDTYHVITAENDWTEKLNSNGYFLSEKYKNYYFLDMTNKVKTGFNKNGKISKTKKVTLKELFDEFMSAREILHKETKGEIDLFRTPMTKHAVQRLFHNMTKSFSEPEPMSQHEQEWHDKAFRGGIIYAEEGEYKDVKCYDQNSQYSHYLSSKAFALPIKAGKFMIVEQDSIKSFASYGIYRCIITSTDETKNKLFRFNSINYYTQHDINNAIKLGFDVKLIQDGEVNHLSYNLESRIAGDKVFSTIIDYLFKLKQKCPYVKKLISALWGTCMERNYNKIVVSNDTEEIIDIPDSHKIITIENYSDCEKIKTVPYKKLFKTNWARVGAFLTSYVRLKMQETITANFELENVIRIHTDGVIVKNQDIKPDYLGVEIGKFKIEKSGDVVIKNSVNIEWN